MEPFAFPIEGKQKKKPYHKVELRIHKQYRLSVSVRINQILVVLQHQNRQVF